MPPQSINATVTNLLLLGKEGERKMKRILASIIVFLFVFSSFAVSPQKIHASDNVIFQDDFESYPVGSFPTGGWELVYNGAGTEYQKITDSVPPSKSFQLVGRYGWSVVTKRDFSSSASLIGYEVSMLTTEYAGGAYCGFLNQPIAQWGRSYATVAFSDGYLVSGESQLQTFSLNTWYRVRVVLDRNARTWDVWVDGVLRAEDLVEAHDPYEILSFQLSVQWLMIYNYYDDVKVFETTPTPNIKVTAFATSKSGCSPIPSVAQNYTLAAKVNVKNESPSECTFNVTFLVNETEFAFFENVTLSGDSAVEITSTWNTTGYSLGTYVIKAVASTLPGELDTLDNNSTDEVVVVTLIGDINCDGYVGIDDIFMVASHFAAEIGQPNYNPNCDINDDGYIGIDDIFTAASHFGEEETP